jgi:hypothetical protein
VAPSTTRCKDNNNRFICQFSTICVWMETQDYWLHVVISSHEREMNLVSWTKPLVLLITNSCMLVAIPQPIVLNQFIFGEFLKSRNCNNLFIFSYHVETHIKLD